ncbi:hypothetical protein AAEP93_003894 [Penicillium crustosum]
MDHVAQSFSSDIEYSSESFIATLLHEKPEHKHLDVLTDLLTKSSEIDERVASSISAAWDWICQNDLWSTRYESLGDYRKAIGYTETVKPIVKRHKKSELAKRSSIQTIFRYWKIPFDKALPIHTRPLTWSKHLLSLTACLSKHLNHLDSLSLLEESMKNRPERGRNRNRLMASDVQRALETLGIPQTRLAARGSRKSQTSSSSAQNKGTDSCAEVDTPPSTVESETRFLPNIQSQNPLSLAASPTQELPTNKDPNEWQCCGCIPICLPLIALITTPQARFDTKLLTALVDWAYTISWGSFCSEHLRRLAHFIPTEDPCDSTRAESPLEPKYGDGCKVFGEAHEILVQPGDLVMCLPQILLWPTTFSSSNFLSLSQIGLDNRFPTLPDQPSERCDTGSSDKVWEQPEPQVHDTKRITHEYHTAKSGLIEDSWCSASSAIGQALTGRLDWSTGRAREEMNCILGSHGAKAVEFVAKSRAQLAKHFHNLCDSIERDDDMNSE